MARLWNTQKWLRAHDQLLKKAEELGVFPDTSPDEIKKPYGMRTAVFDKKLRSFTRNQKKTLDMLEAELRRFHKNHYQS